MSKVTVQQLGAADWVVWSSLGNGPSAAAERESFVIGAGETREAAVAMAVEDLRDQLVDLATATIEVSPGIYVANHSTSVFQDKS